MSDEEDDRPKSFEEALRAIADEVTRGLQNFKTDDLEDVARSYGVDAERAKRFFDNAGDWLRAQAENLGDMPFPGTAPAASGAAPATPRWDDSLQRRRPGPARPADRRPGPRARRAGLRPLVGRARHEHAHRPRRRPGPA